MSSQRAARTAMACARAATGMSATQEARSSSSSTDNDKRRTMPAENGKHTTLSNASSANFLPLSAKRSRKNQTRNTSTTAARYASPTMGNALAAPTSNNAAGVPMIADTNNTNTEGVRIS